MTNKQNIAYNIGYTTKEHLCLDLDDSSYYHVAQLTKMIIKDKPFVGSALILQSSSGKISERWIFPICDIQRKYVNKHSFHVIFDGLIPYEESCKIIENLAYLDAINKEYVRIREMRNDMTIRVSKTECVLKTKPKPVIIGYVINENKDYKKGGIERFLKLYELV